MTFAPRLTISRTNSRLVRRPDPIGGAGSLMSLESGFRTHGNHVEWSESCSHIVRIGARVDQRDRKLEVAVLHREQSTDSCPCLDRPAPRRCRLCRAPLSRRCIVAFTSTPAARNARTVSMWPSRTAKKNGVNPESSCRVDVGSSVDQRADDGGVPLGRRPHQGGLAEPLA